MRSLMTSWITAFIFLTLSPTSALGGEQQLITVKVDGFPDIHLLLITDANNNVRGVRISNGDFNMKFSAQEFKEGYTKKYYGFKAVSIKSPNLDPATGGKIEIEYRRKAAMISPIDKFQAQLKRDANGHWVVESLEGSKAQPFKTMELVIKKEKLENGTFKFLGIDGVNLSAVLDPNAPLVALQAPTGDAHSAVYGKMSKELPVLASSAQESANFTNKAL